MKAKILITCVGLALIGAGTYMFSGAEAQYNDREAQAAKNGAWHDAADYLKKIKGDYLTGEVDPALVEAARKQVEEMQASGKTNNSFLSFESMGPTDQGGRTRAILIDNEDHFLVFAGSVGGGLWKSTNAGGTWTQVTGLADKVVAVSTIAQAANGDIYVGTGATFESPSGTGGTGAAGTGMWKSTNRGSSWTQIVTPTENSTSDKWNYINRIAVDPTNSSEVYAAIGSGSGNLMRSTDGGSTWDACFKTNSCTQDDNSKVAYDVMVAENGTVMAVVNSGSANVYKSTDGTACSFEAVLTAAEHSTYWSRTVIAQGYKSSAAATTADANNYMYAMCVTDSGGFDNVFEGLYQSDDYGDTWQVVQKRMQGQFQICKPVGYDRGQGFYDLSIGVSPVDPEYVIMGGIQLWRWNGNLTQIAAQCDNGEYCVHSDQHYVVFDKEDPDVVYFGCDGGVYKSFDNANTFFMANYGYQTTQFYSIAYDDDGKTMAGSQDNGTWEVLDANQSGEEIAGGDGFDCEYSNISDVRFASVYYQDMLRSVDDGNMAGIVDGYFAGRPGAAFHTVFRLWESIEESMSQDTIEFNNDTLKVAIGTGNGTTKMYCGTLIGTLEGGQVYPLATRVEVGNTEYIADMNDPQDATRGLFKDMSTGQYLSNDSYVDYETGEICIDLPTAPATNTNVWVHYIMWYQAGLSVYLPSNTRDIPVEYTLTSDLYPNSQVRVQDPIQSVMAFSAGRLFSNGNAGSIEMWISRKCLDLTRIDDSLKWIDISKDFNPSSTSNSTYDWDQQATCIEFSRDGDHLFAGIGNTLVRFSGIRSVYKQEDVAANITMETIGSFQGYVTGIAVDPSNSENVLVTIGHYGSSTTKHVERSSNAVSSTNTATAAFESIQGNLPLMPVYDVIIDVRNSLRAAVATEFGVFTCENIWQTPLLVQWEPANNEIGNVAVFAMRQQNKEWRIARERLGEVYLGTHGRGMWRSSDLNATSTQEYQEFEDNANEFKNELAVYPNPMKFNGTVEVKLAKAETGSLSIYNLEGKLVKSFENKSFSAGTNAINVDVTDLSKGTYFVTYKGTEFSKVSKFMVTE